MGGDVRRESVPEGEGTAEFVCTRCDALVEARAVYSIRCAMWATPDPEELYHQCADRGFGVVTFVGGTHVDQD